MPFSLCTEGFRDNPRRFAFLHGPLVLCAEVDLKKPLPIVLGEPAEAGRGTEARRGQTLHLHRPGRDVPPAGRKTSPGVTLEPFYKMHGGRHYMVYWDAFTPAEWQAARAGTRPSRPARRNSKPAPSTTSIPGEEQNERDHELKGERTGAGDFGGRKWRHAPDGWFSWELKVLPDQPQELWVTYWGSDGGRVFDVLVDGQKIATQQLQNNHPDQFYDEVYPLPADVLKGKNKITVKFQAHKGRPPAACSGCG